MQMTIKTWIKTEEIFIYAFPKPLGTKYHGLNIPALRLQLFSKIYYGGMC